MRCSVSGDGATGDSGSLDTQSDVAEIYHLGLFGVEVIQVKKDEGGAPRPVRIFAPVEKGAYPVIYFFPGFLCLVNWYDTILTHLASYGFIVAAIQTMDRGIGIPINVPKIPEETERAVNTMGWLEDNLGNLIEATPDLKKIGYAGHSRGGKVAWNIVRKGAELMPAGIAGIDPVDGTGIPAGSDIEVVTEPIAYDIPSLIIGTGLGCVVKTIIACAPRNDGHLHFWENVSSPAYHVVAEEFGHMEMLDDAVNCGATCRSCTTAENGDRVKFRKQVGGSLAAFFAGVLKGKTSLFKTITDRKSAPILISSESK